jgi:hypothetical protein
MRVHIYVVIFIAILVALAGLFSLLIEDIDTFEARTGFFDRLGAWIINGIVALIGLFCALGAASFLFPRSWGPKAGIGGAIACALVALFCLRVLWLGGV